MTATTTGKTQDVTATTDAQATETLAARGLKAAARFMERKGYEILVVRCERPISPQSVA